jgi:hypothetical protein
VQRQGLRQARRVHVRLALQHHMEADALMAGETQRLVFGQLAQVQHASAQAGMLQDVGEQVHEGWLLRF